MFISNNNTFSKIRYNIYEKYNEMTKFSPSKIVGHQTTTPSVSAGCAVPYVVRRYWVMALWRSLGLSRARGRVKCPLRAVTCGRHTIARGLCYAVGRPPEQKCRRSWPVEWWTNSLLFGGELGIDAEHGVLRLNDGTHDNGNFQCLLGGAYWALRFVKRADAPFRALRILKLSYPVMVNKLQS